MRAISSILTYTVSFADLHLPLLCHRGLHMLCFHCHWTIQVSVCVLTQFSFSRNFFSFEELPDNCGEGRWQPPLTWKPCVYLPGKKWTALFQSLECTDLRNNLHKSPEITKESSQAALEGYWPFPLECLGGHSGLQVRKEQDGGCEVLTAAFASGKLANRCGMRWSFLLLHTWKVWNNRGKSMPQ